MEPLKSFVDVTEVGASFAGLNKTELTNLVKSYKRIKKDGGNPLQDCYVINIGGSAPHYNLDYSPCLTRSRCGGRGYFLSWLSRKITVKETWALQGFPTASYPEGILSDSQLGGIIGNAIPAPLLAAVMRNLFRACGLQ